MTDMAMVEELIGTIKESVDKADAALKAGDRNEALREIGGMAVFTLSIWKSIVDLGSKQAALLAAKQAFGESVVVKIQDYKAEPLVSQEVIDGIKERT